MRYAITLLIAVVSLGFDHARHELAQSGLPCDRCHPVRAGKLVGRPDHAACFGACHGPAPRRTAPTPPGPLCADCHAGKAFAVVYPPTRDFAIVSDHAAHRELACSQCHPQPGKPPPASHARCAGCHDGHGQVVAMTVCAACHVARPPPPPPVLAVTFSHASHAARDKREPCTTCHGAARELTDGAPFRPTTAACATCHDGKRAFAVTAACTRCHHDPPAGKLTVARPSARFSHAVHGLATCATCHQLAPNGEVASTGHAPCAAAGCHADDFGKPEPMTCGACHNGTEPWRHLVADRLPAEATEFGATLDHATHPGPCASCHRLHTASQALRPPRGHAACASAGCHAITGGPAPQLAACDGCHALGRFAARLAARTTAPWSVRASFDHATHARGTDGGELACVRCHTVLAGEASALATPSKATCAPCHDGTLAFKLTGTTCSRCHQARR